MKRTTIYLLGVALMATFAPETNAQGFLRGLADRAREKVKEKVEQKVDNTVEDAADKALNGDWNNNSRRNRNNSEDRSNGASDKSGKMQQTTYGTHAPDVDPYLEYVNNLANTDEFNSRSAFNDIDVETDNIEFHSFAEIVNTFPSLPTAEQIAKQDPGFVKKHTEYTQAREKFSTKVTAELTDAQLNLKKNITAQNNKISKAQRTQLSNNAMQIFMYLQSKGIDPEKTNDKEVEKIIKKAIQTGELKLDGVDGPIDPEMFKEDEKDEAKIDKLDTMIEALRNKVMSVASSGDASNAFGLRQKLSALHEEIQSAWTNSEACKQVYNIEKDIDQRAMELFEKTHDDSRYPGFWVKGRKDQNAIINKFNMQQAEKWRKALQEVFDTYMPFFREIIEAEKELESTFPDKKDYKYAHYKQQINLVLIHWSILFYPVETMSYDMPLVYSVGEDDVVGQ